MNTYALHTDGLRAAASRLRAGDKVLLSGTVYTSRDAAHKRLFALMDEGKPLPFPLKDAVIYYSGATPAPEGLPIGACGPTTSGRMDIYTPRLHDGGLCATIGKGERSPEVVGSDPAVRRRLSLRRGARGRWRQRAWYPAQSLRLRIWAARR